MKISILSKLTTAGLIAIGLVLTGCGKSEPEEPAKGGDGGGTPPKKTEVTPPKKETDPPPPPKKETDPPPKKETDPPPKKETSGGGDIESKLAGYWALDADSIKAMIGKEMGGGEGGEANPFAAMLGPIVEMIGDKMVLELGAGKSKTYSPKMPAGGLETQEGTYKITASDASEGTFTVELTDEEGTETGEGKIDGDELTMTTKGNTTKAMRLTQAEFDKRIKEIETFKLDMSKLIPGGVEGLKDLIPEGIEIPDGLIPEGITIPEGLLPDGVKIPDANKPKPPVPTPTPTLAPGGTE